METNNTTREPLLAADAGQFDQHAAARADRIRSLSEEMADLLSIHCGGDFYAEIYPYGHERGIRLRNMMAPAMTIADLPYRPSRDVPSPAGYKMLATALVGLEEPIERTFQLARLLDDYVMKVAGEDSVIDEDERANLITLSLMMREHSYSLQHNFHRAMETSSR